MELAPDAEIETLPAPEIADGVSHPLDPRYVVLERQVGWIATAVLTVVALSGFGVFIFAGRTGWGASASVAALMTAGLTAFGWWQQVWPPVEYRHASYRVDANGLEIRRGVYFRAVTNVPRSRVQHTDVAQGPLQRRFGLATLIVHTAGNDSAVVELPGLTHEIALAIRDHLLPGRSDDAV